MNIKNHHVFISGGNRGIGLGIVEFYLSQGAQVTFTHSGRKPESIEQVATLQKELAAKYPESKVLVLKANVCAEEELKTALKTSVEQFGDLNTVICNAGVSIDGLILRAKESDWDTVIDTNLKGSFLLSKLSSRYLIKSAEADKSLIFISSVVGLMGNAGQSSYAASKAGQIGLMKSLAKELAKKNVRVNAIAPGYIKTDMTDQLSEEQTNNMLQHIALGRKGSRADIAASCAFLSSPFSQYITGQVLNVNGGLYM